MYHLYIVKSNPMKSPNAFPLKFKDDTLATVSRHTVQTMAKKLGFNETQVVHLALARLRDQLVGRSTGPIVEGDYPPLTEDQLAIVRQHAPRRRRKPLSSESLF